jgi:UDP-glucuronate decarboxylase
MSLDDGRVFADFVSDVIHKRDIIMKSDGSARRAFCYLADAVAGFFTVLLSGNSGEAYNIGNDKCETNIRQLAELLATLSPDCSTTVVCKDVPASDLYMKSAISRNCPDLKQGFTRTIRSFYDNEES